MLFAFMTSSAQELEIDQQFIDTISISSRYIEEYKQIKKALENNKQLKGWTKYYLHKSSVALRNRVNDSALYYANRSIKAYDSLAEGRPLIKELMHQAYYIKGLREYFDGHIEQSLKTLNISLTYPNKISELTQEISWRSFILERIYVIHLEKGDSKLALNARKQTLQDSLYMSYKYEGGSVFLSIGNLYKDYLQELDSAKIFYKRALQKYADATEKDYGHLSSQEYFTNVVAAYENMGDIFYKQQNLDSTLFYYNKAWNTYVNRGLDGMIGSSNTQFFVKVSRGFILFQEGDIDKAIEITRGVRDSIIEDSLYNREERGLRLKTHNFLSEFYEKKGFYKEAIATQKELNNYLITYNERSISKQLQLFTTQYEVKEKDASITQLQATTENQQTIIKQRNTISWVLGGLLLSFIGLGVLFYRQRQLQNKYVASNLEQRLLRSQLNPHFLFNALNAVSNLVQKKSEQTIPYISKLGQLLRSVLEHSREEFVSLEEELETIKTYLELQSNFSKKFQYDLQVNEAIDKEALLIPPMFIQPFVENSIAHGFKGKEDEYIQIVVGIDKTNRTLHFKIEDNGIGYSKSLEIKDHKSGHQSLSGKILKERLSLYAKRFKSKASYTINDIDRGTKVDLYLPYLIDD